MSEALNMVVACLFANMITICFLALFLSAQDIGGINKNNNTNQDQKNDND